MKEYPNEPPKGIRDAIWGACFDYKEFDTIVDDEAVRDRIYQCWNDILIVIKAWEEAKPGDFIEYIKKEEIDKTLYNED